MRVDLRSDTVTMPTEELRRVIAKAPVGDAGYGDDPSVNELQELAAHMTGMEKALFFPSGVMANICALLTLGQMGQSVAIGRRAHIYQYEAGGLSAFAGLLPKPLDDSQGLPQAKDLALLHRPVDVHFPPLSILALENTHNDCGGIASTPDEQLAVVQQARKMGLKIHLDGARLPNAAVACGASLADYGRQVDTVQICLSKGLGAPMGSVLCGSADLMKEAAFHRKRLGGEMRQVGLMAAAGTWVLKNNMDRLEEDHQRAQRLASELKKAGFEVEDCRRRTNMVYFTLPEGAPSDEEFSRRCVEKGLLFNVEGPRRVRLVTSLEVTDEGIDWALKVMEEALA